MTCTTSGIVTICLLTFDPEKGISEMIENVAVAIVASSIFTSLIWFFIVSAIWNRWDKWAIKVGKARYNQTTGILEYDEE